MEKIIYNKLRVRSLTYNINKKWHQGAVLMSYGIKE